MDLRKIWVNEEWIVWGIEMKGGFKVFGLGRWVDVIVVV